MMMCRLALISGLAVLSAVAFAPKAGAQAVPATLDVDFNGTVAGVCSFTGTTPGTLARSSYGLQNRVESSASTGTLGRTTVNCTSGGQITVALPVKVSAPANFTDALTQVVVTKSDGTYMSISSQNGSSWAAYSPLNNTPLSISANTPTPLSISMAAGGGMSAVPTGTYQYRVSLTATPN